MNTPIARAWVLAAACVLVLAMRPMVSGQEAAREDVLTSLLTEVRGLRVAIEQMASAGPRVQLAMGRLQLQEQRVNTLQRRLDDLRDQIAATERDTSAGQDRLASLEQVAQHTGDPAERDAAGAQAGMLKAALARNAGDVQRLKNEEAELAGLVAAEQGRWSEINQRLEELERVMSRQ